MKKLAITTDTILVEIKGEEVELNGIFKDGEAKLLDDNGKRYVMTYPKADTLTKRQINAIENYTNRDLEEYFEVALKYGKLVK